MSLEDIKERFDKYRGNSELFFCNIEDDIDKLLAVAEAAGSLLSELEAEDNAPTHFNVYFILKDALAALEKE